MDMFPLRIFPEESLATSVSTTVWIGVWVIAVFNLRLGWTASGFIVPGYVVPLLIAQPVSVAVILVEAVFTYVIVYWISEYGRRQNKWCTFFGRDRFFALVIVSVLVRVIMDGWLLPWLGAQVNAIWNVNLDYRNQLHSYGLIIASLMANYFYKPGLIRGLFTLSVTTATTYVIVRYGLMEYTNFSIGTLRHSYVDIASSLLASPKAYIVLGTTAFLASWLNMRYSWNYNGILIPALLALQWYRPWKIAASVVEATIVLIVALVILRSPFFQKMVIEGSRKTLIFFNIAYFYRLLLGFFVPASYPDINVTDIYGFGYILSTLLAIKAHDQMLVIGVVRTTLQASMVGAVGGSLLGFMLSVVPDHLAWTAPSRTADVTKIATIRLEENLVDVVHRDKRIIWQKRIPESFQRPVARELSLFSRGVSALLRFRDNGRPTDLQLACEKLHHVNYDVYVLQDRYLYLRERSPANGWGIYILDIRRADGMLVQMPAPLDEWATLDAGVLLFNRLHCGALAVAGAGRNTNVNAAADVLVEPGTMFDTFHRLVARGNVLEVRGSPKGIRDATSDPMTRSFATEVGRSILWIKGSLPAGLDLKHLKRLLPRFQLRWQTTGLPNVMRNRCWSGFAELTMGRRERGALLGQLATLRNENASSAAPRKLNRPLQDWLLDLKTQIARHGTDRYVPPKLEELLYVDQEVLKPLFAIARHRGTFNELDADDLANLTAVSTAAGVVGYQLTLLHDTQQKHDFFVLSESLDSDMPRHWGTCVLRCGLCRPAVVEVPCPLAERKTYDYGVSLFTRLEGGALILAGAHPRTNRDGRADVTRWRHRVNSFNLFFQAALSEI